MYSACRGRPVSQTKGGFKTTAGYITAYTVHCMPTFSLLHRQLYHFPVYCGERIRFRGPTRLRALQRLF